MLPNLSPPIDRSEKAMQGVKWRAPEQAYDGTVGASGIECTLCMAAANALPWPASMAAIAACKAAVC